MNKYFIKNREKALQIDPNAVFGAKRHYECCAFCGDPLFSGYGYLVWSPLSKKELGIMVSSIKGFTRLPEDTPVRYKNDMFDEGNGHPSFHTKVWDMEGRLILERRDGYGWGANADLADERSATIKQLKDYFYTK